MNCKNKMTLNKFILPNPKMNELSHEQVTVFRKRLLSGDMVGVDMLKAIETHFMAIKRQDSANNASLQNVFENMNSRLEASSRNSLSKS